MATKLNQSMIEDASVFGRSLLSAADAAAARTALEISAGSGLADVKYITTSSTWTKPAGLRAIFIVALGAGGGGGYAKPDSSQAAVGGGGGAGERREGFFDANDLSATETITIGALGVGGVASSATAATAGGDTSFGSHITAKGGKAAGFSSSTTLLGASVNGGAVSDAGSGGDVSARGGAGGYGLVFSASICRSGGGADSAYGAGGGSTFNDNSGNTAIGYGAGGGGAAAVNSANRNGGNGAPGIVIVFEYF
jgi:hypothetical protein